MPRDFVSVEPKMTASLYGCPRPTIIQYVRDAAIEVCEKTSAWKRELDAFRLTNGEYQYDFDVPDYTQVTGITRARLNGASLNTCTLDKFLDASPDWPNTDSTTWGQPTLLTQFNVAQFAVSPVPDALANYDVKLFVSLKPTIDAAGMDDDVFDILEPVIIHGALQQLLVLPNKPWSDRELATYHAKQYTYKTAMFRAGSNLGAPRSALSVQMRPLA